MAKEALGLSESSEDDTNIARSLTLLSLFYMITGAFRQSIELAEEAITYYEKLGDERGVADAKYNIAGSYYKTDNFHTGLSYLIECLDIYRKFDDYHNQAKVLKSIGTIYEFFGDQKSAIESYESSIAAARKCGDISIESNAYNPLSGVYLNLGDIDKSLEIILKSIEMKEASGDVRGLAFALYGRGKIFTATGQFEAAEKDLQKSIEIHIEMGEKIGLGMSYHKLGTLYKEMKVYDKAKEVLNKALDFGQRHNIALVKYKSNYLMYELFKEEGDADTALKYHEQYTKEKEVVINTQTFKVIESYESLMKMRAAEREAEIQREKEEIIEKKNLAEQASKMKEDFLSTMSHEIRTPLNAVTTITSLLQDKSEGDEKQLLDALKFSAQNLMLIINDILDFTKLDSGKVTLSPQPTDLEALISNIRNTYSAMAKEKGLELNATISSEIADAYLLDEVKISQILGNLIGNSIKFTDQGTIDLRVGKSGSDGDVDLIKFEVVDSGIGIPEEDFDNIFDSFTQPKPLTTRTAGGSGLGLAIVKKLVNIHGGEINVESKVNCGSRFWFEIPLKSGTLDEQPSKDHRGVLAKYKVLVVDDMMINVMVASQLLDMWGMMIDHAVSGEEAIRLSKDNQYDFILMDIHMPGMDGYEATRKNQKER